MRDQLSVAEGSRDNGAVAEMDYVLDRYDVICQRGKDCQEHAGNRRLMELVEASVENYNKAKSRQEKSKVISRIVDQIVERTNPRGGFVMKDAQTRKWHQVDLKVARDKVGNYLRDAAKRKASTSSPSFFDRKASWGESSEDLRQQMVFSSMERMEATLRKDSDWIGERNLTQSYLPDYQDQNGNNTTPMLPLPHSTSMRQQYHPLTPTLFNLRVPPSTSDIVSDQHTNHPSPTDEEQMKSTLEALAETFSLDDDVNFDLEPRPIEDMIIE